MCSHPLSSPPFPLSAVVSSCCCHHWVLCAVAIPVSSHWNWWWGELRAPLIALPFAFLLRLGHGVLKPNPRVRVTGPGRCQSSSSSAVETVRLQPRYSGRRCSSMLLLW
uniref:Uncharacterized protein n=1 Tax=Arundo donax TaxID=35708 RepID=A0A0A9A1P8_ARUDO